MNFILAVFMVLQAGPDDVTKELIRAIAAKDYAALKNLSPDPDVPSMLTNEMVNNWLKSLHKDARGNLDSALAAAPQIGNVAEGIDNVEVEYVLSLPEGGLNVELQFQLVKENWKLDELEIDWINLTFEGEQAVAETSPGDVMKSIQEAAEGKQYEKILDHLPSSLQKTFNSQSIKMLVLREEKRMDGKWLETLRKFPDIREGTTPLTRIDAAIRLDVDGSGVSISAKMFKENGIWVLSQIDTFLDKEVEDLEETEPAPVEKNPR